MPELTSTRTFQEQISGMRAPRTQPVPDSSPAHPSEEISARMSSKMRDDEYVALMRRTNGKASAAMRWEITRRYKERECNRS